MRLPTTRETVGISLAVLLLGLYFALPVVVPQKRHLQRVSDHIAAIQPQWSEFLSNHPGCQLVELFPYTGDNGLLGASGSVASTNDFINLKQFLEQTEPPRPVRMFVKVYGLDLETYQDLVNARDGRTSRETE